MKTIYISLLLLSGALLSGSFGSLPASSPIASNISITVPANQKSVVQLDTGDAQNTALTYAIASPPAHGSLSGLNPLTGTVLYTPAPAYAGVDSFIFTVARGGRISVPGLVKLRVSSDKESGWNHPSPSFDHKEKAIRNFWNADAKVFDVRDNGATPNQNTDSDTAPIQLTINEASQAGGGVVLLTGGVYEIAKSVANRHVCLFVPSNIHLVIDQGATLKLKSGEMVGNGDNYLHLILLNGDNITIDGGGHITGNATGQPAYTGGYVQDGPNIITGSAHNLTIRDLLLDDNFGNPIDLQNSDADRGKNIRISNIHSDNVGEGIQVQRADGVVMENILQENTNGVAVGDALEVANCADFEINNIIYSNMSGIDIFGSSKGTVTNFVATACSPGIEIHDFPPVPATENVIVSNGVIYGPSGSNTVPYIGVALNSVVGSLRGVMLANIKVFGGTSTTGFKIGNRVPVKGPVTITNCQAIGTATGMEIFTISDLTVNGGQFNDGVSTLNGQPTSHGIIFRGALTATSAAQTANLSINNVTATGNSGFGFFMDDNSSSNFDAYAPSGKITNCNFTDNDLGGINLVGFTKSAARLAMDNIKPNQKAGHPVTIGVGGLRYFSPVVGSNSSLDTLANPSAEQELMLYFTEDKLLVYNTGAGGFNLAGKQNVQFRTGNYLCLSWDGTHWNELWRRTN